MRPAVRLAVLLLGVAAAFAGALLVGRLVGPVAPIAPVTQPAEAGHGVAGEAAHANATGSGPAEHAAGLAVTQAGYTFQVLAVPAAPGPPGELAFRVVGPSGAPVSSYVSTHERPLHLIVVRRDLTGYQHVHPILGDDGVWRVPLALPAAGSYRLIADFAPDGRADSITLGTDLAVPGSFAPSALPAAAQLAEVDGYTIAMSGRPGEPGGLAFSVQRDGVPVTDLQPYLGAAGHLVMLRAGDLAYVHTHPEGGARLAFAVEPPSSGSYRLYLEFQHGGAVHTAEFTVEESS